MFGWCGKILKIDLSEGSWKIVKPPREIFEKYIGGRGLGGYFLKKYITLDWNDPAMPLMFLTGPLVNTISPTSGRMTIMSRSPLTGTVGDCSVGGSLGTELKRAGFDGIIVTGKSQKPCGIEIDNGIIKITFSSHLKNMTVSRATNLLKGKGAVAVSGPAAAHGVLFSNIMIDGRFSAGRNGLGMVFAAKNLKYLTVKGSGKTEVFDSNTLIRAREDVMRLISASPAISGSFGISKFGTGALYDLLDARRMMPTDNFRKIQFEYASKMNAHAFQKRYNPKSTGCKGCHILCKKRTLGGTDIPEFETMSHFSALLGNYDLETVLEANRICNDLGMDTISAAASLSCYAEHIGETLSPEKIILLLNETGNGKGIGKDLGKGAFRYAADVGNPDISITVKGQALPAYDPRGAYGMALAYATSTRGACHLRAYPVSHEILRKPVATDRFSFQGKARMVKIGEDLNAVVDSLTVCKFVFFGASIEEYSHIYTAVTGKETTGHDLLKAGERIYYNERIMNFENGFSAIDDDLPMRFFKDSETGISPINRDDFIAARKNYYRVRGLDRDGKPLQKKIDELGIE
ncbi:MAG: aldehyde ferredoxin oxidoreductase family protein [Desulfobacterales bacterium]|nr:aldehyde ferredoxin oxidoreductase family protein [Desulfobacterales bacterium]